jgi:hypothetical protein
MDGEREEIHSKIDRNCVAIINHAILKYKYQKQIILYRHVATFVIFAKYKSLLP